MRKFLAIFLSVLMLGMLCAVVFADDNPSPTGGEEHLIDYTTYENGDGDSSNYTVIDGDTIRFDVNPDSDLDFTGFDITGDYELIEGSLDGPYIIIRPLGDLVVIANYDNRATDATKDTGNNGPQTGVEINPWLIGGIAAVVVGVTFAIVAIVKKPTV